MDHLDDRAARHAALGDPARLAIVDELVWSDRAPAELGRRLGLGSNLLAHHLAVLESAGLVDRSRSSGDGRRRYVHLRHGALADLVPGGPGSGAGRCPAEPSEVLFVCTHNSARSQLAAVLWTALTGGPAASAGTHPAERVHRGAVSGAHFNPVVTLTDRFLGTISTRDAGLYVVAQVVGGCLGAVVANLMFELPAVQFSTTDRSSPALWLSEVVATVGLLLVIQGCVRTGRARAVPFAVGAWIAGAYWFTSSTSFANPAVTVARTLSDTFAGIAPASAPLFIVMQLVGMAIAVALVRFFYPHPSPPGSDEEAPPT